MTRIDLQNLRHFINKHGLKCRDKVLSIIVFGSYSTGLADNYSDIDIAVFTDEKGVEEYVYMETRVVDLDVIYIPLSKLEDILEELDAKASNSLWITHSLYFKILEEPLILCDRDNILHRYLELMKAWKWSRKDIENAKEYAEYLLDKIYDLLFRGRRLEALLILMDAFTLILMAKDMILGLNPSPHPKDTYSSAIRHKLLGEFTEIYRLKQTRIEYVYKALRLYENIDDPYFTRNRKSIKRELLRGSRDTAILMTRKTLLGYLDKRLRTPKYIYNPELKIKIIEDLSHNQRKLIEKLYGLNTNQ